MDEYLFGDPDPMPDPRPPTSTSRGIADWQVTRLRSSLDAMGLTDMPERQAVVERLAGRPVASLRDLTFAEAVSVIERLTRDKAAPKVQGSSWDDREEATWIDRL